MKMAQMNAVGSNALKRKIVLNPEVSLINQSESTVI